MTRRKAAAPAKLATATEVAALVKSGPAYHVACAKGTDVDQPRNLATVESLTNLQ